MASFVLQLTLTTVFIDFILACSSQALSVSALEAEIDRLVYELYGLSEGEIAIVEGKK